MSVGSDHEGPDPDHSGALPGHERVDPVVVERAATALLAGEAVVLPTDTVYGVAALPGITGATGRLWSLKGRDEDKPLAVLVADVDQGLGLLDLDREASILARRWADAFWPGALTIVGTRHERARGLELGSSASTTIGVRCPADPTVRAIAHRVGPIAATSANRSGRPTETTADAAAASLLGPVAVVVDGGPGGTVPSTVVDLTGGTWRVLRTGDVGADQLERVASGGDID